MIMAQETRNVDYESMVEKYTFWPTSGSRCTSSRATVDVRCKNYSVVTSETSVAHVNGVSEAIFKVGMCLPGHTSQMMM